jgi:hypothetical protein
MAQNPDCRRAALARSALLAAKAIALPVAGLHHHLQDMSHHFMRQMSGDVFGAMVPKTNALFPVTSGGLKGQPGDAP